MFLNYENTFNFQISNFILISFRNLKTLKLAGMPYLEDKALLRKELSEALPDCAIEIK